MLKPAYLYPFQNRLVLYALLLIALMHIAGGIGLAFESSKRLFQALTPFSLWTSGLLLLLFQEKKNRAFWIFAGVSFFTGFFVEVLGVQTGKIFGVYSYGEALGVKILGVPLTIGLNWLVLVLCTGYLTDVLPVPKLFKAILGGIFMVAFDYLMEPPAIALDFWRWESPEIPLQNYLAWFATGFFLHLFYQYGSFWKYNFMAVPLFLIQTFFFISLNLSL
jgi:putative membrane protein